MALLMHCTQHGNITCSGKPTSLDDVI